MSSSEAINTDRVVDRLDLIITLLRITLRTQIEQIRNEIEKDAVSKAVIDLAQGIPYSELLARAAEETGTSERTVKRRVSELRSQGLLLDTRDGSVVRISKSSLLE